MALQKYGAAISLKTDQTVEKSHIAKMSVHVSPLFMVRFEKCKIWHTQDLEPDLEDLEDVICAMTSCMCGRH